MKNISYTFKYLLSCWAIMATLSLSAQVEYKVELKPDGSTYQVVMRPLMTLQPGSFSTTFTGQVTLVVPTGTFTVATKTDLHGDWGTLGNTGTPSTQTDPQGLGFDYISFALQSITTEISYEEGVEVVFFEFTNGLPCSGDVFLMEEDDPYADNGMFNVGQQLTVLGYGPDNAWQLNYDLGAADCTADVDGDGFIRADDPDDNDPCIPDVNAGLCDQDNDGLTNDEEITLGTSPTNPDTDNDGINDGDEVAANPDTSDPLDPCDPNNTDSDNDGICDSIDPDPNDPCVPNNADADGDGVCDTIDPDSNDPCNPSLNAGTCDQDNDGLTNEEEDALGTSPTNPDTDNDGINDGDEVAANPNPSDPLDACDPDNTDTDNDGLCDNIDPAPNDACIPDNTDTDNDGICDNIDPDPNDPCIPNNTDTDGDGLCDTIDPDSNDPCNPSLSAGTCDQDNDGLTNEEEGELGTNPNDPDTDNDGINDGDEVAANPTISNPLDPCDPDNTDTDNDGLCDNIDPDPNNPCVPNGTDTDNDGVCDNLDPDPNDPCIPDNTDTDNDGLCDNIDPDPNNPCVPNGTDTDNDGVCDNLDPDPNDPCIPDDTDTDNDGLCDNIDPDPNNPCVPNGTDTDNDGVCDNLDPDPNDPCIPDDTDTDNDGLCDNIDPDPNNPCVPNGVDTDNDGVCDNLDPDPNDPCNPELSAGSCDQDNDGLTNEEEGQLGTNSNDPDTDNDGINDGDEVAANPTVSDPLDPCDPNNADADNDGICDTIDPDPNDPCNPDDTDTDNDGLCDNIDPEPNNPCVPNGIDADNDGICDVLDPDDNDPCNPELSAGACDQDNDGLTNEEEGELGTNPTDSDTDNDGINDGDEVAANPNTSDPLDYCDPIVDPNVCTTTVAVAPKVFLQGAYSNGLMRDDLRVRGFLPTTEPYSGINNYQHVNGGGEITSAAMLNVAGINAIVDWVFVELRASNNPSNVLVSQSALVQRDGDVVAVDGVSALEFDLPSGNYYLSVRHRNHLGVMTANSVTLSSTPVLIDFTSSTTATWGTNAQRNQNGNMMLWGGNANSDDRLIFQGVANDNNPVFFNVMLAEGNTNLAPNYINQGYHQADNTMDGDAIFQGNTNDLDVLIFFNVLFHPSNTTNNVTYIVMEQLP